MKRVGTGILMAMALTLLVSVAPAQKRAAKTTRVKSTTTVVPPLEVRAAREKVTVQHDNVVFWIDKLGPVASALEVLDKSYATRKPSQAKLDTLDARKQMFVKTLGNLREDLALLESEFRTRAELQKYLPRLQGVSELAADAQDSAISGKFVASRDPLRAIEAKLTDALAVMPR